MSGLSLRPAQRLSSAITWLLFGKHRDDAWPVAHILRQPWDEHQRLPLALRLVIHRDAVDVHRWHLILITPRRRARPPSGSPAALPPRYHPRQAVRALAPPRQPASRLLPPSQTA